MSNMLRKPEDTGNWSLEKKNHPCTSQTYTIQRTRILEGLLFHLLLRTVKIHLHQNKFHQPSKSRVVLRIPRVSSS
jgi:hypothetical protein